MFAHLIVLANRTLNYLLRVHNCFTNFGGKNAVSVLLLLPSEMVSRAERHTPWYVNFNYKVFSSMYFSQSNAKIRSDYLRARFLEYNNLPNPWESLTIHVYVMQIADGLRQCMISYLGRRLRPKFQFISVNNSLSSHTVKPLPMISFKIKL